MSGRVFGLISIVGLALSATVTKAAYVYAIPKDNNPQLLEVKIYTEALCRDCKIFIQNQLYPAMITNGWLKFTDLKFVPYGNVKRVINPVTKVTKLYCQHGYAECELNALYACIVEHNTIKEQLYIFKCMKKSIFSNTVDRCAYKLNINVRDAKQCKETRSTTDILKKYGDDTVSAGINFVPSIAIDGQFLSEDQIDNFPSIFCRKYNEKYGVKLPNCP